MDKDKIENELDLLTKDIAKTRKTLDEKAVDCINNGDAIADDIELLRHSGQIDDLFLTEQKLRQMMEQFGGSDEIPD